MSGSLQAAILLYHRVGEPGSDPLGMNVSPEGFEQQLRAVADRFSIAAVADLADGSGGAGPLVAITFDDGYRGVLDHAKPVLERLGVRATAFIPSGFVGAEREFWWEELEAIIFGRSSEPLPRALRLPLGGSTFGWRSDGGRSRFWSVRLGPRERLYYDLARQLACRREGERAAALRALARWAGTEPVARHDRMPLTRAGLAELAAGDTIEIGAHTVTHPILAALEPAEQLREVAGSKAELEAAIGRRVTSFAYPFGGRSDYSRASVQVVRSAGFELACANVEGTLRQDSSRFELPRLIVRDWNAAELVARVEAALLRRSARMPRLRWAA